MELARNPELAGGLGSTEPLINKPPLLDRDYNTDPNIKALKRRGFINHGSTLGLRYRVSGNGPLQLTSCNLPISSRILHYPSHNAPKPQRLCGSLG